MLKWKSRNQQLTGRAWECRRFRQRERKRTLFRESHRHKRKTRWKRIRKAAAETAQKWKSLSDKGETRGLVDARAPGSRAAKNSACK